ncbi:hypothetical protein ElyMa_000051200 [Elysia marginata]|uniref:Uncharacterized protein n=1 Tax=Elysia marginata TaxID=1093978 RepID=A0AAV4EF50_9GAST|nr:hypothetical protein ElyMa_000051200 [Elysia marginata]
MPDGMNFQAGFWLGTVLPDSLEEKRKVAWCWRLSSVLKMFLYNNCPLGLHGAKHRQTQRLDYMRSVWEEAVQNDIILIAQLKRIVVAVVACMSINKQNNWFWLVLDECIKKMVVLIQPFPKSFARVSYKSVDLKWIPLYLQYI